MSAFISQQSPPEDAGAGEDARYPCLVVESSPHEEELGAGFLLLSEQVTLGRDAGCALVLKDPALLPRHTVLRIAPGPEGGAPEVRYCNPGPLAGAAAGDSAPALGVLRLGETLQLGSTCLRYGLAGLEPRLCQVLEAVTGLMREGRYEEALSGLAPLKKHRPAGGSRATRLERLLLAAQFLEARIHAVLGRWSTAIGLLEELITPDNLDWELRLRATFQLGSLYVLQSNLEGALTLVGRLGELAQGRDGYFLALALCLRGMTAARLRDFPLARRAFRDASAKLQLSTRSTRNLEARIQLERGVAHFLAEEHEQALELFTQLKPGQGDGELRRVICAEALRYSAVIHSLRREFELADGLLGQALETFRQARWHFLEYKAEKSRGLNLLSWGRLEEATQRLERCQELLTHQVENPYERAVCAGQLGKVYLSRGDAQEALRWFTQERQLQAGLPGVTHSQGYTYRNFARAHRNLGNAAEAALYYARAAEMFHQASNWVQKGLTLVELCRHRLDTREPELAEAGLHEAEASFTAAGRRERFAPTLAMLRAQVAWARGEGCQAQALFASSLEALREAAPCYLLAEVCLSGGRLHGELYRRATRAQAPDTAMAGEHYQQAKLFLERGRECAASQGLGWLLEQFHKEMQQLPACSR